MHWMMTVAQINFPSDETVNRLLDSRIDQVAAIIVLSVVILLISSVAAVVVIARIVGRGIDRQNDALENERKEKHAAQEENKALSLRVDQLDRRITEMVNEAKLAQVEANKEREILMLRLSTAESQAINLSDEVRRLKSELNDERKASMVVLAENERLRTENGSLKNRIEELERRIADLEKRQTDTHTAATAGNGTPESKIETAELNEAQTRILGDVQKSLQEKGE